MTFVIKEINSKSGLIALANEWDSLLVQSQNDTIFLTHEWLLAWWETYGANRALHILQVMNDEKIIGFLPFMIRKCSFLGFSVKIVEFLGSPRSDYSDFIITESHESVLEAFVQYLCEHRCLWDIISLSQIPETSSSIPLLRSILTKMKMRFRISVCDVCPSLVFTDKDSTLTRQKIVKKNVRKVKALSQLGCVKFYHSEDFEQIQYMLVGFFKQHIYRWQNTLTPSLFHDVRHRQFYARLAESFFKKKWLRFGVLQLDEKTIAFHFGFQYKKKLFWYKPSFDVAFAQYSPGDILIKFLIEYAFDNHLSEFDFTRGNEPFKDRFANLKRNNYQIWIYQNFIMQQVVELFEGLRMFVRKRRYIKNIQLYLFKFFHDIRKYTMFS